MLTRPSAFVGTERLYAALEKVGEQLRFGIDPRELEEFLAKRGLRLERDLGAAEYRRLQLGEAAFEKRGHEFHRVARARADRAS